jgi:hypothetical protein
MIIIIKYIITGIYKLCKIAATSAFHTKDVAGTDHLHWRNTVKGKYTINLLEAIFTVSPTRKNYHAKTLPDDRTYELYWDCTCGVYKTVPKEANPEKLKI